MDLSIAISPELEDAAVTDASLASPMSKHQRQLSLSAKWASNKALALEYLKRQRVRSYVASRSVRASASTDTS